MRTLLRFAQIPLVLAAAVMLMGAGLGGGGKTGSTNNNNNKNKNKKAGESDSVKKWGSRDFATLKDSPKPFCVYIFDPDDKNNTALFEGDKCLGAPEIKDKLKAFACVKIATDAKIAEGWPADWTGRAKHGCALVLITSDLKQNQVFDKNTPKSDLEKAVSTGIEAILKYEEQLKAQADKAPKKAPDKPADKPGDLVDGKKPDNAVPKKKKDAPTDE